MSVLNRIKSIKCFFVGHNFKEQKYDFMGRKISKSDCEHSICEHCGRTTFSWMEGFGEIYRDYGWNYGDHLIKIYGKKGRKK